MDLLDDFDIFPGVPATWSTWGIESGHMFFLIYIYIYIVFSVVCGRYMFKLANHFFWWIYNSPWDGIATVFTLMMVPFASYPPWICWYLGMRHASHILPVVLPVCLGKSQKKRRCAMVSLAVSHLCFFMDDIIEYNIIYIYKQW